MVLFIDFPPISDHKPLLIKKGKCFSLGNSDNSFSLPKKETVKWDRLKCLNEKESIFLIITTFSVLENVIQDPNISIDDVSKKFISTSFDIAKELDITFNVRG